MFTSFRIVLRKQTLVYADHETMKSYVYSEGVRESSNREGLPAFPFRSDDWQLLPR
jgi:hypothetical protein